VDQTCFTIKLSNREGGSGFITLPESNSVSLCLISRCGQSPAAKGLHKWYQIQLSSARVTAAIGILSALSCKQSRSGRSSFVPRRTGHDLCSFPIISALRDSALQLIQFAPLNFGRWCQDLASWGSFGRGRGGGHFVARSWVIAVLLRLSDPGGPRERSRFHQFAPAFALFQVQSPRLPLTLLFRPSLCSPRWMSVRGRMTSVRST
jgi:hypothetical protein